MFELRVQDSNHETTEHSEYQATLHWETEAVKCYQGLDCVEIKDDIAWLVDTVCVTMEDYSQDFVLLRNKFHNLLVTL